LLPRILKKRKQLLEITIEEPKAEKKKKSKC
jgi:hypothetical protein